MTEFLIKCKKNTIRPFKYTSCTFIESRTLDFKTPDYKINLCKKINYKSDYENNYGYTNMRLTPICDYDSTLTNVRFDIGKNIIQYLDNNKLDIMDQTILPTVKYHDYILQINSKGRSNFKISYDVFKLINTCSVKLLDKISLNSSRNEVFNICFSTDDDLPPVYEYLN